MKQRKDRFRSASQVLGKTILDVDDEKVGEARDLLVDVEDGRIAYLRITLGRSRHGDEWVVTVPWSVVEARRPADALWRLRVRGAALSRLAHREERPDG